MTDSHLRDDISLEHQLVLRSSSTLLQKEFEGTFGAETPSDVTATLLRSGAAGSRPRARRSSGATTIDGSWPTGCARSGSSP